MMSNDNAWFSTANIHLDTAYNNLNSSNYPVAYEKAFTSVECLFKAVLVKAGKFKNGSDYTHDHSKILDKIKKEKCLPSSIISDIEDILYKQGFHKIDVTSEQGHDHMDCYSVEYPNLRYPVGNSDIEQMIRKEDAEEKITQAEDIFSILKPLLTPGKSPTNNPQNTSHQDCF